MFSRFFIDRPIFASVMSILITLTGGVAAFNLPLAQYPQITPPSILVSCTYPGASAKVVAESVAAPIEQQVNGVEDMLYMSSQSANDGSYSLSVKAAEATRQSAQNNVDYCVIKAPFDGRISRLNIDLNNDVIADTTVLASLVQLDPLYGYFDVDERTLLRIGALLPHGKVPADASQKFPLTLGLANEKPEEFTHKGTLKIADNRVDPTTGTVRMWGVFANPDYDLKPGMFVRVRMDVGRPRPALFVAEAALGSDQGRRFVYVVADDGKTVYTQVEVGQRKDGRIAVRPAKGYTLTDKDRVVVNGLQRVHADQEVGAQMVDMPRAALPDAEPAVVVEKKS